MDTITIDRINLKETPIDKIYPQPTVQQAQNKPSIEPSLRDNSSNSSENESS